MQQNGIPGLNLGANWTPLTRNVLLTLFGVYVAQQLSGGRADALFAWQPFGDGFQPWQIVTSFVLGGDPVYTVLDWLVLYFVLAPVDGMLGRRGLVQSVAVTWATGVVITSVLLALGLVGGVHAGIGPLLAALVAIFGFMMPNAQFLLFFIIPVRAIWLAWGTGLMSFLFLLWGKDIGSSLTFFGWVGATAWMAVRGGALRRFQLRWKKSRIERKLARFEVIEGGRTGPRTKRTRDPNDWVN
jgi:hypothetical protein